MKFKQETTKNGIWTDWIRPKMNGYHMSCCDCGLVYTLNFRALRVLKRYANGLKKGEILPKKEYEVEFKLYRNEKLTKQQRKKKKP